MKTFTGAMALAVALALAAAPALAQGQSGTGKSSGSSSGTGATTGSSDTKGSSPSATGSSAPSGSDTMKSSDTTKSTDRMKSAHGRGGEGMSGNADQVKAVQQALKDQGHDPGAIDGVMGPKTQAALRDYQQKQGLKATGRLDAETSAKLGVEAKTSAAPSSSSPA